MTEHNPGLAVLIVSDGVPGHVSQARGLVRWLATRFQTRADEHRVVLRARSLARLALPPLLGRGSGGLAAYRLFHGDPPRPDAPVDVVVSAGGNTAFANVLLARHLRRPNVFLGSRRRLPGHCFTAHLTLEPTGDASNIVMNVAPSPSTEAEMAARGCAFVERHGMGGERLWLMACGGDGAGKTYRAEHWRELGRWMNDLAAAHGVRWLISTSRRTGRLAEDALRSSLAPDNVAYGVWWSRREERILGDLMGAAERLFVTVDSMSMISECIAAAKPLTLVHTGDGTPNQRYQDALGKYQRLGLCRHRGVGEAVDEHPRAPPPLEALVEPQIDELARRIAPGC